jgi:hypothetical protein
VFVVHIDWVKYTSGQWINLDHVNLDEVEGFGVYVIWHAGNPGRVVRVGHGDIRSRLTQLLEDPKVTAYRWLGALGVTWGAAPVGAADGIEAYLADRLKPLVADLAPAADPIAVNAPW